MAWLIQNWEILGLLANSIYTLYVQKTRVKK